MGKQLIYFTVFRINLKSICWAPIKSWDQCRTLDSRKHKETRKHKTLSRVSQFSAVEIYENMGPRAGNQQCVGPRNDIVWKADIWQPAYLYLYMKILNGRIKSSGLKDILILSNWPLLFFALINMIDCGMLVTRKKSNTGQTHCFIMSKITN